MLVIALLLAQTQQWHAFETTQLSDEFFAEGASFADFDRDGHGDVVSGPFVYFGPDFKNKIEIYPPKPYSTQGYSNNFFAFPQDLDGDGWTDLLVVGFPGQDASWFKNPGAVKVGKSANGNSNAAKAGESASGNSDAADNNSGAAAVRKSKGWTRFRALDQVDNESPQFEDINGDGQPELICMTGGRLGWADFDPAHPEQKWSFHPITSDGIGGRFTHGLGVGDMNGDGRMDLLMKQGWWTQPASLSSDPEWKFTAYPFAGRGGAQMYVYDVDGDGDGDVITADNAHGYGLAWFERLDADAQADDGESAPRFTKHPILGSSAAENSYSVVIGNLHAMDLVDMDGDGLLDLVTGARFWAHGGNDIADHEPALVHWFRLQRTSAGAEFIPHIIDEDSGVGTQVVAGDVNGDGLPDVVVGNKKGTFIHINKAQSISDGEFRGRMLQAVLDAKERQGGHRAAGVDPVGADGKTLNLGFERGDLSGWTAEGDAFKNQPVQGDTVNPRRGSDRSGHQGEWWIGGFEKVGDGPTGKLTSDPFVVTHPFASFLVGGGAHNNTVVQILDAANGDVLFETSGKNRENMRSRWVDLSQRIGQKIKLHIEDFNSGGWGHINFDDFRFHAETEEIRKRAQKDMPEAMVKGFLPQQAAERMTVPEGFHADLIAGEPRLHQPIAMTIDARGRIWVAEAYSYPVRRPDDEAKDHILVFEDTNHDGNYDKRTVFLANLNLVSGLEVGFGGVWIGAAPYLMFVPDVNDDLIPDAEPKILLDGWGYQDTHETLNAFNWGPDGWLYGCHGVFTHSNVGKPGTPDHKRTPMNAGVWRYHPVRHHFEVFAWGSSNPWGVDFDDRGQAVITACVIPHLYHIIQGARYTRQGGRHFNEFVFDDIKTVADHLHYLGATPHSGNGNSDSVGGGHAHCGAAIYLADQFPAEYRNRLFVFNVHGKRMNSEFLTANESGLIGSHAPDFMIANDKWFLGVAMRVGPDGSLYFIDWYDKQACHRREVEIWDRSNGRLFRVRYGDLNPADVNLPDLSDEELVDMQLHANDWYVRQARRILQERGPNHKTAAIIFAKLQEQETTEKRLRLLWALHSVGGIHEGSAEQLLQHADPYVRAWTIQLALDGKSSGRSLKNLPAPTSKILAQFNRMAASDPSPVVRLYLASALQRMAIFSRGRIVRSLMSHAESADDHNLPLMIWYGYEAMITASPKSALKDIRENCKIPLVERFTYRRLAAGNSQELDALCKALTTATPEVATRMIEEMAIALQSRPDTAMPRSWPQVSARFLAPNSSELATKTLDSVTSLALAFGDVNAAPPLRQILSDATQSTDRRILALDGLLQVKDPELLPILHNLLEDPALRLAALPKLASYDSPKTPTLLLAKLASFTSDEQTAAAATLASRPSFARAFLNAVLAGNAPQALLDSATLRLQLSQLNDPEIAELLTSAWGRSTQLSESAAVEIEKYKTLLTPTFLADADLSNGRVLYRQTCWACHDLFGDGQQLGPGLTGSNRADLDYILTNILDPSAEVGREYLMTTVTLKGGRVISGMVVDENNHTLTLQNGNTRESVRKSEIKLDADSKTMVLRSSISLMPAGQLQSLDEEAVRDLIAYLASPSQVPLPATEQNLSSFFNGKNLTGWIANPEIWSVQQGEIVGRTANGIDYNDFACSDLSLKNFRLTLEVKLVDDIGNSGIQFRSRRQSDGSVQGLQADIGKGWWGKLYEEHGRGLLEDIHAESHVRKGEWNQYEIVVSGDRILTALNGQTCVDRVDPEAAQSGIIALQLHSGGATEVRFRNLRLELNPKPELNTLR